MLKVWIGIGISLLIIAAYFGVLLVSSTKESDDKYVVGVLRTGYKIFEYFNRKKNNLGIYLSYIILWSWTGESAESSVADLKRGTQHAAA